MKEEVVVVVDDGEEGSDEYNDIIDRKAYRAATKSLRKRPWERRPKDVAALTSLLRNVPFFAQLSSDATEKMLMRARYAVEPANSILLTQGQTPDRYVIVLQGKLHGRLQTAPVNTDAPPTGEQGKRDAHSNDAAEHAQGVSKQDGAVSDAEMDSTLGSIVCTVSDGEGIGSECLSKHVRPSQYTYTVAPESSVALLEITAREYRDALGIHTVMEPRMLRFIGMPLKHMKSHEMDMLDDWLKSVPFLRGLSRKVRLLCVESSCLETYQANDVICEQGEEGFTFHVILDGSCSVHVIDHLPDGETPHSTMQPPNSIKTRRRSILQQIPTEEQQFVRDKDTGCLRHRRNTLDEVGTADELQSLYGKTKSVLKVGDCFGEMALMNSQPRTASIICIDDMQVLTMSKARFDAVLACQKNKAANRLGVSTATSILSQNAEERSQNDLDTLVQVTRHIQFFQQLTPTVHRELCRVMTMRHVSKGEVVVKQGDNETDGPDDQLCFYVIFSGTFAVFVNVAATIEAAQEHREPPKKAHMRDLNSKAPAVRSRPANVKRKALLNNTFSHTHDVTNKKRQAALYDHKKVDPAHEFGELQKTLIAGDTFGELAIIGKGARTATVVAHDDESILMCITKTAYDNIIGKITSLVVFASAPCRTLLKRQAVPSASPDRKRAVILAYEFLCGVPYFKKLVASRDGCEALKSVCHAAVYKYAESGQPIFQEAVDIGNTVYAILAGSVSIHRNQSDDEALQTGGNEGLGDVGRKLPQAKSLWTKVKKSSVGEQLTDGTSKGRKSAATVAKGAFSGLLSSQRQSKLSKAEKKRLQGEKFQQAQNAKRAAQQGQDMSLPGNPQAVVKTKLFAAQGKLKVLNAIQSKGKSSRRISADKVDAIEDDPEFDSPILAPCEDIIFAGEIFGHGDLPKPSDLKRYAVVSAGTTIASTEVQLAVKAEIQRRTTALARQAVELLEIPAEEWHRYLTPIFNRIAHEEMLERTKFSQRTERETAHYESLASKTTYFNNLPPLFRKPYCQVATTETFEAGGDPRNHVLFCQGDIGDKMYIVIEGSVELYAANSENVNAATLRSNIDKALAREEADQAQKESLEGQVEKLTAKVDNDDRQGRCLPPAKRNALDAELDASKGKLSQLISTMASRRDWTSVLGTKVHTGKCDFKFGDLALLNAAPRSVTVLTSPHVKTTLLVLDRDSFERIGLVDVEKEAQRKAQSFFFQMPIFSSLTQEKMSRVQYYLHLVNKPVGSMICMEGAPATHVFFLKTAECTVHCRRHSTFVLSAQHGWVDNPEDLSPAGLADRALATADFDMNPTRNSSVEIAIVRTGEFVGESTMVLVDSEQQAAICRDLARSNKADGNAPDGRTHPHVIRDAKLLANVIYPYSVTVSSGGEMYAMDRRDLFLFFPRSVLNALRDISVQREARWRTRAGTCDEAVSHITEDGTIALAAAKTRAMMADQERQEARNSLPHRWATTATAQAAAAAAHADAQAAAEQHVRIEDDRPQTVPQKPLSVPIQAQCQTQRRQQPVLQQGLGLIPGSEGNGQGETPEVYGSSSVTKDRDEGEDISEDIAQCEDSGDGIGVPASQGPPQRVLTIKMARHSFVHSLTARHSGGVHAKGLPRQRHLSSAVPADLALGSSVNESAVRPPAVNLPRLRGSTLAMALNSRHASSTMRSPVMRR